MRASGLLPASCDVGSGWVSRDSGWRAARRYRQGEVHRLRGERGAAESAYRDASRLGREPQPGLALLRLAQGERESALSLVRRALAETEQPGERLALLIHLLADEARYAAHLRDWLDARGGHSEERRLLADVAGYPSLRA
jgi:hypothetical protein